MLLNPSLRPFFENKPASMLFDFSVDVEKSLRNFFCQETALGSLKKTFFKSSTRRISEKSLKSSPFGPGGLGSGIPLGRAGTMKPIIRMELVGKMSEK